MPFINSYHNYCVYKLSKLEKKLSEYDESIRTICNNYDDSIKFKIYSDLISNDKYKKLIKKISILQLELEIINKISN